MQGRSALNSALARYGERILDSPVIVEGYSDGDEVNDHLAASRHRAILVRNYCGFVVSKGSKMRIVANAR